MRKSLCRWEIAGFLFVCIVGTVLHFLYRWTGNNRIVAAFAAVNESTWEHMKLLFVPYFVFTMVQFTVFAEPFRNFFACKAAAAWVGIFAIPTLYYTLSGVFGKTPAWLNVTIFVLSAALMYFVSCRLLTAGVLSGGAMQILGFAVFWVLLFLFVFFTYRTPRLPLFFDPVTGCCGLSLIC